VVGVEGDFQGASQKDSSCIGACGGGGGTVITSTQKVEWFATARGRFGYTGSPWLIYVTGGAAWANVHNDLAVTSPIIEAEGSANFNVSGWTIGGGIEVRLAGAWTGKLEYLYLDLGSITDIAISAPIPLVTVTQTSDIRDHIVRVGLNYKFY
jgi:outer membrane immunogenic protein